MFPSLSLSMCSVGILEDASKSSLGARLNRELGLRPLELSFLWGGRTRLGAPSSALSWASRTHAGVAGWDPSPPRPRL